MQFPLNYPLALSSRRHARPQSGPRANGGLDRVRAAELSSQGSLDGLRASHSPAAVHVKPSHPAFSPATNPDPRKALEPQRRVMKSCGRRTTTSSSATGRLHDRCEAVGERPDGCSARSPSSGCSPATVSPATSSPEPRCAGDAPGKAAGLLEGIFTLERRPRPVTRAETLLASLMTALARLGSYGRSAPLRLRHPPAARIESLRNAFISSTFSTAPLSPLRRDPSI